VIPEAGGLTGRGAAPAIFLVAPAPARRVPLHLSTILPAIRAVGSGLPLPAVARW